MASFSGLEGIYINTIDNLPYDNDYNNTTYLKLDGTSAMNGDIDVNSNRIINCDDPIADQDVATKKFVNDNIDDILNIKDNLDMNNYGIITLADPINNTDATNKKYVDEKGADYVDLSSLQDITGYKQFYNGMMSGYTMRCINSVSGINSGWGIGSQYGSSQYGTCLQVGAPEFTGIMRLKGTSNDSLIQQTTHNLHLDTIKNDTNDGGIFLNNYSANRNTIINPNHGTGQCLIGTATPDNWYKCTINKGDRNFALKVNGVTSFETDSEITLRLHSTADHGTNVWLQNKYFLRGTETNFTLGTNTNPMFEYEIASKQLKFTPRINLPGFTTAERDLMTPCERDTIYNTTTKTINYYNGTEWKSFMEVDDERLAKETTIVSTWSGARTPAPAGTIHLTQTGKTVHLSIIYPVTETGTDNDIFRFDEVLPVDLRPVYDVTLPILIWNGIPFSKHMGSLRITTDGNIYIWASITGYTSDGNFTVGSGVGFEAQTVSYCIP